MRRNRFHPDGGTLVVKRSIFVCHYKLDIGLAHRNLQVSEAFGKMIATHFNKQGRFLDFAGGMDYLPV